MTAPAPPLALVTGGTRRIGAAIAGRLAAEGFALALHVHKDAAMAPDLATTLGAHHTDWAIFPADLAESKAVEALVPAVEARFGRAPAVLVNSASLWSEDDWTRADMASLDLHFRVNAAAPTVLAQRLAARVVAGSGTAPAVIVNVLDQRIAHPHGDQLSYTASKMALGEMTRLMARALAPHARVMGVAPGLTIATPEYDAAQLDRLASAMPLGLLPTPADIADAVLYAIRARASTGHTLFVDGGASLVAFDRDFVHLAREPG